MRKTALFCASLLSPLAVAQTVTTNNINLFEHPLVVAKHEGGKKMVLLAQERGRQRLFVIRPVDRLFQRDSSDTYYAFNSVINGVPKLSLIDSSAVVANQTVIRGRAAVDYVSISTRESGYQGRQMVRTADCGYFDFADFTLHDIIAKDGVATGVGVAKMPVGSRTQLSMITVPLDNRYDCQFYPLTTIKQREPAVTFSGVRQSSALFVVDGQQHSISLANKSVTMPAPALLNYLK
ncbi:hypothetical protein [uncultured Photobacterium sp.]|uniref:hypothetical protein n=1 Tax=uncultured Photobacterium sp. TaxID=173973 RepID=UPI002616D3EF|nr:hypothetical protein [uncultured Photobacterium sp.]